MVNFIKLSLISLVISSCLHAGYSINLLWIYKDESTAKKSDLVFPDPLLRHSMEHKKDIDLEPIKRICKWASFHEKINIWYNSTNMNKNADKNTLKKFSNACPEYSKRIQLKDINTLKTVTNLYDIFSEMTNIYFKADLIRMVAAYEYLKDTKDENENYVYADFSVDPIEKKELFDEITLQDLNKYHFILAKSTKIPFFENGFFILKNTPELLRSIKTAIIDRAFSVIGNSIELNSALPNGIEKNLDNGIFTMFNNWIETWYSILGKADLKKHNKSYDLKDISYTKASVKDMIKNNRTWFDINSFNYFAEGVLLNKGQDEAFFYEKVIDRGNDKKTTLKKTYVPTKDVKIPLSHFSN